MNSFALKIISSDGSVFETECSSLVVPTDDGYYGIMSHHSPVIIAVAKDKIKYTIENNTEYIDTNGAILRFDNNEATILSR